MRLTQAVILQGNRSCKAWTRPTSETVTIHIHPILDSTNSDLQTPKQWEEGEVSWFWSSCVMTKVFHQPLLAAIMGGTSQQHHFQLTNKPYQRTFWHFCVTSPIIFSSNNKRPYLLHTVLHLESTISQTNDKSIPFMRSYNKITEEPLAPPLKVI